MTIQSLIKGRLNAGIVVIVVGKLNKREFIIPTTIEIDHTISLHIL